MESLTEASIMMSIRYWAIVTALVLMCASSLDAGKKSRRNNVHENIEIYYPKGLTVWYPKHRGLVGLEVEIFLNQKYKAGYSPCDICLTTTSSSYGKFIIHDDNAVIRAGDSLKYRFELQRSNGRVYNMSGEFYVSANRMLRRQDESPSTPTSPQTEIGQSKVAMLEENINLLENIMQDVLQHCNNVTDISKNLYLVHRPRSAKFSPSQLYEYTRNELESLMPKIDWNSVLTHVFYYNDGIGFDVKTVIDKLKILKLSKNSYPTAISDMDDLYESYDDGSSDDYNDITFHAVTVAN